MAFVIKNSGGGGNFAAHPAGVFASRCVRLVDLGTQAEEFQGRHKNVRKIVFFFETSELIKDGEFAGKPMMVTKEYSAFLNDKATLRKDLESWRGRAFTESELERFDIENVLGKPLYLNIQEYTKKNGQKSTKIAGLMPLPSGITAAPASSEPFYFSLYDESGDNVKPLDTVNYEKLSKFWQGKIAASPEFIQATGGQKASADEGSGFDDMDDDIPF